MIEVCSTTLPQMAIPRIFQHPEYFSYLESRRHRYEKFSSIAYERLKNIPGVLVNRTNGAFYMSVVFEEGRLTSRQTLPIAEQEVRDLAEELTSGKDIQPDKRFTHYLLAAAGICVVPLTSFSTDLQGFRFTLLEPEEAKFCATVETLARSIEEYLQS